MKTVSERLVSGVEQFLTWRNLRRYRAKLKQQQKHPVRDWIEAFLQAALIVLLVNQYCIQAYQIPSASMRNTLIEGDHIFVNKVIYGPQLLPGLGKLPGFSVPERGDIIIFENPSQQTRSTAFYLLHRVLYMLTLSMVDIDRDETGNPRASLLIKRAIGMSNDRIKSINGDVMIRPQGASRWHYDYELYTKPSKAAPVRRLVPAEAYDEMPVFSEILSRSEAGILLTQDQRDFASEYARRFPPDINTRDQLRISYRSAMNPADRQLAALRKRGEKGWFLPAGHIMPMGDNRDNSHDGRNFGFIEASDVLGRAMFIYWPVARWRGVR